jgi:hypothetical protein
MGKFTTKRAGGKPLPPLISRLPDVAPAGNGVKAARERIVYNSYLARAWNSRGGFYCTRDEMIQVRSTGFSRKSAARPPKGGTTNGAFSNACRII